MRILLRAVALSTWIALAIAASSDEPDVAKRWVATLNDSAALLRDGSYETARRQLGNLLDDMVERIGPGEPSDRFLAVVISMLAVADAGSGEERDAIWRWHTAQNIYPAIRDVDLVPYGAAGQLLRANLLGPRPEKCAQRPAGAPPPVITNRVEPIYPEGARQFRQSGIVIVQARFDAQGRAVEPYVLKTLGASVTYAALDALRRWRYEPLPPDDPLKDVPFCTTFNFKLVK